jgi:uncharacterized protein YdaL
VEWDPPHGRSGDVPLGADVTRRHLRRRGTIALGVAVLLAVLVLSGLLRAVLVSDRSGPARVPIHGALVLYDTSGPSGYLGELYAVQVVNLLGHFGTATAMPATKYARGDIGRHTATVYIGSTYNEPLPPALLDDVNAAVRPVLWLNDNIWQLTARDPKFVDRNGWRWRGFDLATVTTVLYKGASLTRQPQNTAGIMGYTVVDPKKVQVLAQAVRSDGSTFPWAVRSGSLTYVGELPFPFVTEGDRYLAFCDLLFDALDPGVVERHRALVRLEDVGPTADPAILRSIADFLSSQGVPFSVALYPVYRDPKGVQHSRVPTEISLHDRPTLVDTLRYMVSRGATLLLHGYTHQYATTANPYDAVSGDDFEFFAAHVDKSNNVVMDGPVPGDSEQWALQRIDAAEAAYKAVDLPVPTTFMFPANAGSAADYRAVASRFPTRYERSLYFSGVLTGTRVDPTRYVGQFFPYVVHDVYGSKVIPENLGDYAPTNLNNHGTRAVGDLIASARQNLVVRDGIASFYFHPYLADAAGLQALRDIVTGIKSLGYTFVDPNTL